MSFAVIKKKKSPIISYLKIGRAQLGNVTDMKKKDSNLPTKYLDYESMGVERLEFNQAGLEMTKMKDNQATDSTLQLEMKLNF